MQWTIFVYKKGVDNEKVDFCCLHNVTGIIMSRMLKWAGHIWGN